MPGKLPGLNYSTWDALVARPEIFRPGAERQHQETTMDKPIEDQPLIVRQHGGNTKFVSQADGEGFTVAEVFWASGKNTVGIDGAAYARLFAASPAILKALKNAAEFVNARWERDSRGMPLDLVNEINVAIAKAEGRS